MHFFGADKRPRRDEPHAKAPESQEVRTAQDMGDAENTYRNSGVQLCIHPLTEPVAHCQSL
jgi:hypothetical protein